VFQIAIDRENKKLQVSLATRVQDWSRPEFMILKQM
jgi:hypothetical protein